MAINLLLKIETMFLFLIKCPCCDGNNTRNKWNFKYSKYSFLEFGDKGKRSYIIVWK